MRKILMTLVALAFICFHAAAQKTQKKPAVAPGKPGQKTAKGHRWRKPVVSQDFQICRGNAGYYICNETPGPYNATHPGMVIKEGAEEEMPAYLYHSNFKGVTAVPRESGVAPQSQSYPENTNYVPGIGDYPYNVPHHIELGPF